MLVKWEISMEWQLDPFPKILNDMRVRVTSRLVLFSNQLTNLFGIIKKQFCTNTYKLLIFGNIQLTTQIFK